VNWAYYRRIVTRGEREHTLKVQQTKNNHKKKKEKT
jgi:hypothetical protein